MFNYKLIRKLKNEKTVTLSVDYSEDLTWCIGSHHWKGGSGNSLIALVRNYKKTWGKDYVVRINGQRVA